MKHIILLASLAFGMMACNHDNKETKVDSHAGHNHETEDHSAKENKEDHSGHDHSSHNDNHVEGQVSLTQEQFDLTGITSVKLEKANMSNSVNVSGQIAVPPLGFASVYAPLGGFIRKGDLLPGDFVKKGQTLAIIEHPDYIKVQEKFLKAKAQREFYNQEYKRQQELNSNELSSVKHFQESELNRNLYEAEYQSLKQQLKMIGVSTQQLIANGIQKRILIPSPISGYITENNIHLGKYVTANDLLYGIVNKADMHAELQVYTANLGNMTKGMPFEFTVAGSETTFKGEIALIGETVDMETKTVDIHGEIIGDGKKLKPGMFINAKIFPGERMVYVVPNTSIFEKDDKKYIFRKISDLNYEPLEVKLGLKNDNFTEIEQIEKSNFDIEIVKTGIYQLESALIKEEGGLGHGHSH